jgi:hypothetical protein
MRSEQLRRSGGFTDESGELQSTMSLSLHPIDQRRRSVSWTTRATSIGWLAHGCSCATASRNLARSMPMPGTIITASSASHSSQNSTGSAYESACHPCSSSSSRRSAIGIPPVIQRSDYATKLRVRSSLVPASPDVREPLEGPGPAILTTCLPVQLGPFRHMPERSASTLQGGDRFNRNQKTSR